MSGGKSSSSTVPVESRTAIEELERALSRLTIENQQLRLELSQFQERSRLAEREVERLEAIIEALQGRGL